MPCSQVALGSLVKEIHESVVFTRSPFRDWDQYERFIRLPPAFRHQHARGLLPACQAENASWVRRVCARRGKKRFRFDDMFCHICRELCTNVVCHT